MCANQSGSDAMNKIFNSTNWPGNSAQTTGANAGSSQPSSYVTGQQPMMAQEQTAFTPVPSKSGRFSFNNRNFRIADSNMNSSDSGLNV